MIHKTEIIIFHQKNIFFKCFSLKKCIFHFNKLTEVDGFIHFGINYNYYLNIVYKSQILG
jgi:hypothetical protein